VLVVGIWQLFEVRFESGDVYPPYSSLRADPLGTMAFYESLGKVPGVSARRDFSTSNRLPEEPSTAYLHLAADTYEWEWMDQDLYHEIKDFLARGGRLVITYSPETEAPYEWFTNDYETTNSTVSDRDAKDKKADDKTPADKKSGDKKVAHRHKLSRYSESDINWEDEMGFHTGFDKLEADGDVYAPVPVVNESMSSLPYTLDWHSGMIFTNCDKAWRVIYARDANAVMIERNFGKGSVVIASDSYFASNEAMTKDRHADLLAWLVGPAKNVVFDEAHLGILDTDGVASLMRKYRLHGLAAGLILLALLFIWKNSTSLVPPHREQEKEEFIAGKDTASGFVNLLRRSIPPHELLATCFAEWKKTAATSGKYSEARRQRAEAVYRAENPEGSTRSNPVETYRRITAVLGDKRGGPGNER
jgi:hypothetical protein